MIIGLVGKPSSGKSTFFKAATLAEVAIAPYPFTTIDKNEGVAYVKTGCVEGELKVKCQPKFGYCKDGIRFIPTKLIDVAGLVPGAHAGKGRGNQFLDDLREADILIHIVDASGKTNAEGNPADDYNVLEEVRFLQDEIDLWLYDMLVKKWATFSRRLAQEGKLSLELAKQLSGLKVTEEAVVRVMKHLNLSESVLKWKKEDVLAFSRGK
ncbi:50S ribosome-binding GTPase [Candidatus Pacearchaeota archaeon]|nr:50S ribosome-binding GTPase [Candidatus Pacearchaeota archaeon]